MESSLHGVTVTRSRSHPYSTVRGVRGVSATNVIFRYIEYIYTCVYYLWNRITRTRSHPFSTVRGVNGVSAIKITLRYIVHIYAYMSLKQSHPYTESSELQSQRCKRRERHECVRDGWPMSNSGDSVSEASAALVPSSPDHRNSKTQPRWQRSTPDFHK